jgi:hypothetical protein
MEEKNMGVSVQWGLLTRLNNSTSHKNVRRKGITKARRAYGAKRKKLKDQFNKLMRKFVWLIWFIWNVESIKKAQSCKEKILKSFQGARDILLPTC